MKKALLFLLSLGVVVVMASSSASAQGKFAGTWELDKTKSQNLSRGLQDAESVTLTITSNDKQLTLEPKVTAGNAPAPMSGSGGGMGGGRGMMMGPTSYNVDGTENSTDSERGKSTTKATIAKDWSTLDLSTKRTFSTPNGEVTATTTDKLTLSADGKVLTDVRHSESPRGPQDSTLVYNRKG